MIQSATLSTIKMAGNNQAKRCEPRRNYTQEDIEKAMADIEE